MPKPPQHVRPWELAAHERLLLHEAARAGAKDPRATQLGAQRAVFCTVTHHALVREAFLGVSEREVNGAMGVGVIIKKSVG